jgi:hypothetical protein
VIVTSRVFVCLLAIVLFGGDSWKVSNLAERKRKLSVHSVRALSSETTLTRDRLWTELVLVAS